MLSHQTRVITRTFTSSIFITTTVSKLSPFSSMAIHERPANQIQIHTTQLRHDQGGARSLILQQGPSKGKILTVIALLPVGGILLGLAGIILAVTMIGIALATPVFVIFSPVIIPAALTVGIAVAGFLTSGTFGLTGLRSLSLLVNCVRQATGWLPEKMENSKGRMQVKAHEMGVEGQMGAEGQSQSQGGGRGGKVEK